LRIAGGLAGAVAVAILGLLAIHLVAPQRTGTLALTLIAEPYLALVALLAVPVALRRWPRWPLVVAATLIVFSVLRYGPTLVSLPAPAVSGDSLAVVTWNILADGSGTPRLLGGLARVEADLVGIEELHNAGATAIESDQTLTERYPHRVLRPDWSVLGIGLLSRHAIVEHETWTDPPLMRAVVQPDGRQPLTVFVGHPLPARIHMLAGLVPVGLDATVRDEKIQFIRTLVERDLAAGQSVLVIGDFNVTSREPAYATLAAGLRDAHLEAGLGPGFTWRPPRLAGVPMGLLRIDYILASADFRVSSAHADCAEQSDHCRVSAVVWRPATGE